MATTTHRIHNFSAGPAVLPVSVLEEAQRDLVSLPGVGMSVLEISHRSKTFEGILAKTEADVRALGKRARELQGAVPAGRRLAAVLDGAPEPADPRRHGRLHHHRRLGAEGAQGSAARGHGQHRGVHRGRELLAHPAAGRAEAHAERRLRAHDDEQHAVRDRVDVASRRWDRCRSWPTPRPTCSAGRSTCRSTASSTRARRRTSGRRA